MHNTTANKGCNYAWNFPAAICMAAKNSCVHGKPQLPKLYFQGSYCVKERTSWNSNLAMTELHCFESCYHLGHFFSLLFAKADREIHSRKDLLAAATEAG